MQTAQIPELLLLDFEPATGLGAGLRDLLESLGPFRLELRRPTLSAKGTLVGTTVACQPDLLLAILCPELVREPRTLVASLRREIPEAPIVVVLEQGEPDEIFRLLQTGVQDFLIPPLRPLDVLPRIRRLLEHSRPREASISLLKKKLGLGHLVGESAAFLDVIEKVPLVARCDATILISGETGTGKELVARAIHYLSPRAKKPFIAVNCSAIPLELIENELFGHHSSAYTGATTPRPGLIQEAEGGTLFLDEVDSLPLLAQVKLLRFLQEKEYRPLGAGRMLQAHVRVVAAANSDLERAVEEGRMRQDLYYRLSVIPLLLPALRERREDIPLLAHHFLAKYAREMGQPILVLPSGALQTLLNHSWPGNVRELEHVVQRAVVLSQDQGAITANYVILPRSRRPEALPAVSGFQQAKTRAVAEFEAAYIRDLLLAHRGNISQAAKAAEKNRRAFWELIRKHGIDVQRFRPAPPG